jgi:hypothetical protein
VTIMPYSLLYAPPSWYRSQQSSIVTGEPFAF